jgi:CTP synthase (UTP-ammonia lyase)
MIRVSLVGDRSDAVLAHTTIPKALKLAEAKVGQQVEVIWMGTDAVKDTSTLTAQKPHAIWCVPGSPYASMEGALASIRFARENRIPFLGTCGGFQHALIEYARDVLGIKNADHQESNPAASEPIISKLVCSMVERSERVTFATGSRLRQIYGATEAMEAYHCSYGVNPNMLARLQDLNLVFGCFYDHGEVRGLELRNHPFFIATLFQPERSSASGVAHPVITAFLRAALAPR